jgi:hypothetical protein
VSNRCHSELLAAEQRAETPSKESAFLLLAREHPVPHRRRGTDDSLGMTVWK